MKIKGLKVLGVAAVAATFLVSCNQETTNPVESSQEQIVAPSDSQVIPGQYIVVFNNKDGSSDEARAMQDYARSQNFVRTRTLNIMNELGAEGEILNVYSQTINGAAIKMSAAEAEKLRSSKDVSYIEEDRIVMFAPPWERDNSGGGGGSTGQEVPYGITRVNGGVDYSTGTGVAWIIDTGIDLDHPDLKVDANSGFNAFSSGRDAKSTDDGNGHGTHVAGTIAALDNEIGVVGVAAGATVIPVKVLDSRGSGSYSGVIAGVDYVGANGASGDVANMSLGGPVSTALDQAVVAAASNGIIFVLAAGNESDDANNHSPARANGNNVYTISAMDSNDKWASFSNYGNPPVDYCAPGVAIKSTWKDGGYNTISGTSMAAPHAAGVLLLGNASTSGSVNGDPDGNADPIIVH